MSLVAVRSPLHPSKRSVLLIFLFLIGMAVSPTQIWGADNVPPSTPLINAPTPGLIIENVGQFPPGINFVAWGGTQPLWLGEDAIYTPVRTKWPRFL